MNAQQAGAQTRARIIRMIQRMARGNLNMIIASELIAKIRTMDERQNKRKGGQGRK